jgi:hypothetical protein
VKFYIPPSTGKELAVGEAILIRRSRLGGICGMLACGATGIFLVAFFSYTQYENLRIGEGGFLILLGLEAGVLLMFICYARRYNDRRPQLVIDDRGLSGPCVKRAYWEYFNNKNYSYIYSYNTIMWRDVNYLYIDNYYIYSFNLCIIINFDKLCVRLYSGPLLRLDIRELDYPISSILRVVNDRGCDPLAGGRQAEDERSTDRRDRSRPG